MQIDKYIPEFFGPQSLTWVGYLTAGVCFIALLYYVSAVKRCIQLLESRKHGSRPRSRLVWFNLFGLLHVEHVVRSVIGELEESQRLSYQVPPPERAPLHLNSSLPEDEVLKVVAADCREVFAAEAVVLLTSDNSPLNVSPIVTSRVRINSPRLASAVFERYRRFLVDADRDILGFVDHVLEDSAAINLAVYGFRYSMSFALAEEPRLLLWIGYGRDNAYSEAASSKLKDQLSSLKSQLRDYFALRAVQKALNQEKELNEDRARMLAFASHDIKTPLHNLRALLSLIQVESSDREQRVTIDAALKNCDVLSDVVDDALDYARFRAGNVEVSSRDISLNTAIERALDGIRRLVIEKGLAVECSVPTELIVHVDPRHFQRMLTNLLSNAVKYTQRGSIHVIATLRSAQHIELVIADTGIGMTAAEREQMFTAYSRFARTVADGDGLGLTLVKLFAEANRCTIAVESRRGVGTAVSLRIPVAEIGAARQLETAPLAESHDSTLVTNPQIVGLQMRTIRTSDVRQILVVDDNIDHARSLQRRIALHGVQVDVAQSLAQAQGLARFGGYESILTDLSLPDGDGEQLLRFCLAQKLSAKLIAISGRELKSEHRDLAKRSDVVFLTKPVSDDVLINHLGLCSITGLESSDAAQFRKTA